VLDPELVSTVIRYDRGEMLRRPKLTDQGFLRVDGYAARAGIYEYRNDDGTTRYELRPLEEVSSPESLASYEGASATLEHPAEEVTADNVRRYEVGAVLGPGRMDGNRVAISGIVKDAKAIKAARAGKIELSPGYRIRIDATSGFDRRYTTPSNPLGRYDVIQRDIRINHLAIVDRARGGSEMRLRMDAAEHRADASRMTTETDGHQHLIDLCDWQGMPMTGGTTSCSMSPGAEEGHSHPWVRDTYGVITVGSSNGHTHDVIAERSDQIDQSGARREPLSMADNTPPDPNEQIRLLTVRADQAESARAAVDSDLKAARRDAAERSAQLKTALERITALEAQIAAGASAVETEAIAKHVARADAAEAELARIKTEMPVLVSERAGLIARVGALVGSQMRLDSMSTRDLLAAGVKHMRPREDVGPHVTQDFLAARFQSLYDARAATVDSMARATAMRADAAPTAAPAANSKPNIDWREQWKLGAGQYAATHRKEH
jgi:hypothetical protein